MIQILEKEQYSLWNSFIRQNNGSFLQTSKWPSEKFFIVAKKDQNGDILWGCKIEERKLWVGKTVWLIRRRGTWNPAPEYVRYGTGMEHGIKDSKEEIVLLHYLIEKAKTQKNVVMVRVQLPITNYQLPITRPQFLFHIEDPKTTLLADLSYSEDELMREMHEKTRYNIRLAEKRGVVVRGGELGEFYSLYSATNQRKGLKGFSKEYFENLLLNCHSVLDTESKQKNQKQKDLESFGFLDPVSGHGMTDWCNGILIKIFTAYCDNKPLASNLFVCFGDTATYLFGGTSDERRELMAPYALHWECIKWAKANGCRWYDWWGIEKNETQNTRHDTKVRNWEGITRFKKGFTSEKTSCVVEYGETVDVVINRFWYYLFGNIKRFL